MPVIIILQNMELQQGCKRPAEHEVKPPFQKKRKDNKLKPIPKVPCKYFLEGRCSKVIFYSDDRK